jgi:beta-glucanase (GH16 family)
MAWAPGQLYGRWEVCAQSPPASPNYHSVALLWPESQKWPTDGEIDFMEILDPARQVVTASMLHLRTDDPATLTDPNYHTTMNIDTTQWHSWAVEWTPDRVVGYVDGVQWFEATAHVPQTPMNLCLQLDNFGGDISQGGQMNVDWARQYPVD